MITTKTPFQALLRALEVIGSQAAMARLCEVSYTAVWKWVRDEKPLPPEMVLRVEAATGISRHDLRPDIYPLDPPPAPIWNALDDGSDRINYADSRSKTDNNNTPPSPKPGLGPTRTRRSSGQ